MYVVYKMAFFNMRPVGFRAVGKYDTKAVAMRVLNEIRNRSAYVDHSESYWEYVE